MRRRPVTRWRWPPFAPGASRFAGWATASLQGDARFADLLGAMGCTVERRADATVVSRAAGTSLRGIDVDMADMSDLVPTVAAVAMFADDADANHRRRVHPRQGERPARRPGARARRARRAVRGDRRRARRASARRDRLHGAALATHHDHRLAMAFGVLGTVVGGIEVADPDVVTKSWPGFWQMLDELGR